MAISLLMLPHTFQASLQVGRRKRERDGGWIKRRGWKGGRKGGGERRKRKRGRQKEGRREGEVGRV